MDYTAEITLKNGKKVELGDVLRVRKALEKAMTENGLSGIMALADIKKFAENPTSAKLSEETRYLVHKYNLISKNNELTNETNAMIICACIEGEGVNAKLVFPIDQSKLKDDFRSAKALRAEVRADNKKSKKAKKETAPRA